MFLRIFLLLVLGLLAVPAAPVAAQQDQRIVRVGQADQRFIDFSIALSQQTFDPAGGGDLGQDAVTPVFVVLGRDDDFADSLAAGPLLGGAPLLGVPGGEDGVLPEEVEIELRRLLQPGATVYLAGGEGAVSADIETAVAEAGFLTIRLGGEDRTQTAASVATEVVRLAGDPDQVLVVEQGDWRRIAVAGAYAADGAHPLLLTDGQTLSEPAATFLEIHGEDAEVIVVGPTGLISEEVAQASGADTRIAGSTPAETATLLLDRFPSDVTGASLVSGADPDGFEEGVAAATLLQPVLFCTSGEEDVNQRTAAAIGDRNPVFVVGGSDQLPDEAVDACVSEAATAGEVEATPGEVEGSAVVQRIAGEDRIQTALETSRATFGDGEAGGVVLSRSDIFPDALTGTPVAVAEDGPLLLTSGEALDPAVADEVQRVLASGGTVSLLGGTAALSTTVADDVDALGFEVVRYGGTNRFETAAIIATEALEDPDPLILADGENFPDAVTAGAAAAATDGAVLLTAIDTLPPETREYLDSNPLPARFAVGGPAAAAAPPDATRIVGQTRVDTSVRVAEQFFDSPSTVGLATGQDFPDALAGGAAVARTGGPLLLTSGQELSAEVEGYLSGQLDSVTTLLLFGGTEALSAAIEQALTELLAG